MKTKNIISTISFSVMLLLILAVKSAGAQTTNDYVFIEPTAAEHEQLQEEYKGNSKVNFNMNMKPALYVYGQMMESRFVNNLFIYAASEPGILKFGSGNVSLNNIDDYANDLAQLSGNVNGSIIIHSTNVFSGASGELLKEKLEAHTGLPVIMDVEQQPFSN